MSRPSPSSAAGAFARRFRLLMSYHDLTLRDIAAATHSAVSTVGTWKNGRIPSESKMLEKLAEIFQVSVDYLLEGQRPARPVAPRREEVAYAAGRILEDLDILFSALAEDRPEAAAPVAKDSKVRGHASP